MFGKKSGFNLASLTKTAASFGITPNLVKKHATIVGGQLATSAKAGLNARVARTAAGLQTKIGGAPPTPTPTPVQIPTMVKPPGSM